MATGPISTAEGCEIAAPPCTSELFPRTPDPGDIFMEPGDRALPIGGIINRTLEGRQVPWRTVSRPAVRTLLELAAIELDLPTSMLGEGEFTTPLRLLDGRALASLYQHVNRHPERNNRNIITLIQDTVGIEVAATDVIKAIQKGKKVTWRLVPQEAARGVLEPFAESLGVPPSMLTFDNLQYPNMFFRGGSLAGMLAHSYRHPNRGGRDAIAFILQDLGFTKNAADIIDFTQSQANPNVHWKDVPWNEVHTLLNYAADEAGIPVNMLTSYEFRKVKFGFLGGATLGGLLKHWTRHPERTASETSLQYMRRNLGLPEPARGSRARFRFTQMLSYVEEGDGNVNGYAEGAISRWVSSIANIYSRRHAEVELNEIENEIIVFMNSEEAQSITDQTVRLSALHKHLETYLGNIWTKWYREKLLSAPVGDTDITLGDSLEKQPHETPANAAFSPHIESSLAVLTPHQRHIVMQVAVEERSLDELAAELEIDIDALAEQYDEALRLMRMDLTDE